ncbi:MAG: GIY-YIG nuclease family protein [Cyanobacteria bacterium J06650_10]
MSWLEYGIDGQNSLVSIRDVGRGRSKLRCPYCAGLLTAKKGKKIAHHFAHSEETCSAMKRDAGDLPLLPFYSHFGLDLSPNELRELTDLWNEYGVHSRGIPDFKYTIHKTQKLLKWNDYIGRGGAYEFTKKGKVPLGALSMMLFNNVQKELLLERHDELESSVQRNLSPTRLYCNLSMKERLADLRLYRAQLKRLLDNSLYYLKIEADEKILYKIGVTSRSVEDRIKEISAELNQHFENVSISIVDVWERRGAAEYYFKHRYRNFNTPIGSLTEYFQFSVAEAKKVQRDLRRMKPNELSQIELDILNGESSGVEKAIAGYENAYARYESEVRRAKAISVGMKRTAHWGGAIGRPRGSESDEKFLSKLRSQLVIRALREGLSLRKAARRVGVSVNTVRKVRALQRYWPDELI